MNILLCHRPGGAFGYITDGWLNALRDLGHLVLRWDGQPDTWSRFQPQLYLGCSGHRQPIPPRRDRCKVAIHVNPYGPVQIKNVSESPEAIGWTIRQRPDAVFGYGHDRDRLLWSYWVEREGLRWVPLPTGGDATLFRPSEERDRHYDLVYLGGRWPYKSRTIDKFLLPLLGDGRISYKLHGWGDWPDGVNSGPLADNLVCGFLGSGKVAPCLSEPHTQLYGFDVPERMFKAALCGTLVVHDPVPDLGKLMPSAVVAQNPQNFVDLCMHYSRPANAAERLELACRQRREVLDGHTYHHRMGTLLEALGFRPGAR